MNVKRDEIVNKSSADPCAAYVAYDEQDALERFALDQGYSSYAVMMKELRDVCSTLTDFIARRQDVAFKTIFPHESG